MKHKNLLKSILSVMLITLTTVISIFITSCAEEEENKSNTTPSVYKVSVISGEGGRAKTSETELIPGWEVTITAIPEDTYRFVNWTVGGKEVSKENPYTIAINQNTQFKANFEKDNYTLKVTAGEGGSVKSTSEGELLKGTKVTLTATPNEGYSFVNWTLNGEVVSTKNIYTITITSDVEYIANFISYNVTVESGEGGTAKTDKMQVAPNGKVTLTAISQEGYVFESWTVNEKVVSTANPYMATITADTKFKANFVTLHKVTVIAGEGGTATANKTQVGHNGKVTLTATPNEGYSFVNWTINDKEVSTQNPYTATITEDIEIKANFSGILYTINTNGENVEVSNSKVKYGDKVTIKVLSGKNQKFLFMEYTMGGKSYTSHSSTLELTVTSDIRIDSIIYAYVSYIEVEIKEGEGSFQGDGELINSAYLVESATFLAEPKEGYRFSHWCYSTYGGEMVYIRTPYVSISPYDSEIISSKLLYLYFTPVYPKENGHEYVDLGLSVKWATCNVGATFPEEYGDYFAWGETSPKTTYNWSTYKWCNGSDDTMTKYCTKSSYGTVDNKTTLALSDDAARVNWGGAWRMPTLAEQEELINNCTWTWTTQNGVNGYKVTSKKNGNSIFLPAAGHRSYGNLYFAGSDGNYWSSSLSTGISSFAYDLYFYSDAVDWGSGFRVIGYSVRAVCE